MLGELAAAVWAGAVAALAGAGAAVVVAAPAAAPVVLAPVAVEPDLLGARALAPAMARLCARTLIMVDANNFVKLPSSFVTLR